MGKNYSVAPGLPNLNISLRESDDWFNSRARSRAQGEIEIANATLGLFVSNAGDVHLDYAGRPAMSVTSVSPAEYQRYGHIRNRAPRVEGRVAIRGFMLASAEEDKRGEHPLVAFEAPDGQLYADYAKGDRSVEAVSGLLLTATLANIDPEALGEIG